MEKFLIDVRDALRSAMGGHMVASTVFAQRLPTIMAAHARGIDARACARSLWGTDWADNEFEGD